MSDLYPLKVTNVTHLTDLSVKITFDIPEELQSKFQFEPGQYITLQQDINGEKIRRAYSICSVPKVEPLSVAVKKIPNGKFSTYAKEILKEGDVLEVFPPEGRFAFLPEIWNYENLGLFAAGSGITPIMSILKSALELTNLKIVLVYGNRSEEDTIFLEELKKLEQTYSERFSIQWIFSRKQSEKALFGRIDKPKVNFIVKNKFKQWNLRRFYICGPQEMVEVVSDTLLENGVDKFNIHTELFTVKTDENQVQTGNVQVKIILDREELEISSDKSKSILEIALENDLDAPYSCQGGVCSSCMARVEKGEIKMIKNQVLTDNEIGEGLILTCQSYAVTDEVVVDYDDI